MVCDRSATCQSGLVDPTEARQVLGVTHTSTRTELQVAYRRLIRRSHPDIAADPGAHERAARLTQAYAVATDALHAPLDDRRPPEAGGRQSEQRAKAPPSAPAAVVQEQPVWGTSASSFHPTLLEACSLLGEIIGIDRSDHAVQVRIEANGFGDSSLLVQLEERDADLVAVCSLESVGGGPTPRIADVVADLHRALDLLDR